MFILDIVLISNDLDHLKSELKIEWLRVMFVICLSVYIYICVYIVSIYLCIYYQFVLYIVIFR